MVLQPKRIQLHNILMSLLESPHVYYQPPNNLQMQYPCIVYNRDSADMKHADNSPYRYTKRYQVTVIDRNPDSGIPDKVAALPMCSYDRFFTNDNLNHDVFTIFF